MAQGRLLDITASNDLWQTDTTVVLRHDNGNWFTSNHYRQVADDLRVTLSSSVYRHPDGTAFIERVFRTLKEAAIWPSEFALSAITEIRER